jgi:3-phosphoshikimate 1-carboxyvinyltransferase
VIAIDGPSASGKGTVASRVAALFADGPSTIRNIGSWHVKETDRITAMATELRKLGATVVEGPDFLKITPPAKLSSGVAIDTYDDHRIAMCFSLAALGGVPVTINDPDCVAKTFPDYFRPSPHWRAKRPAHSRPRASALAHP